MAALNNPDPEKLREISKQQSYFVVMQNDLVQKARYTREEDLKQGDRHNSLTAMQNKALLYLISKIKPDDRGEEKYYFSLSEFCRVCNMYKDSGENLKDAKSALQAIADKSIWVRRRGSKNEVLLRWLNHVEWIDDKQSFEVTFHPDMLPYLYGLREQYTQYSLENIITLESKYGIHLYKLLKSYEGFKDEIEFSLDDLRKRIDAEAYTRYPDFKRRVLDSAVKDINECSDIEVTYKPIQGKRRTTEAIVFSIRQPDLMEGYARMVRKIQRLENHMEVTSHDD